MSTAERAGDRAESGQVYRFERFGLGAVLSDMRFPKDAPRPGSQVPPFHLPTLDGGTFSSDDLKETGPALVVFGSSTCPMTDSSAPRINELYRRFGDRVRFVLVAVREAHPGSDAPQPQTMDEKIEHAEMMRDLHGHQFEVAVDDIDGTLHQALSPMPNSAYILDREGTIVYRAHWANNAIGLPEALAAAAEGKSPRRTGSDGTLGSMLRMFRFLPGVLNRSGKGAWRDMWRAMPPMAMTAAALKMMGVGRGKRKSEKS